MKQKIEIDLDGETEGDLELAFEEVCRLIKGGFTSGMNTNSTGGFVFRVINNDQPNDSQSIPGR